MDDERMVYGGKEIINVILNALDPSSVGSNCRVKSLRNALFSFRRHVLAPEAGSATGRHWLFETFRAFLTSAYLSGLAVD